MRRTLILLAATAAAALGATAAASAQSPTAAKLQLHKTSVGTILVDTQGATLYAFTKDKRNVDTCARISGCLGLWPLLAANAKPAAGSGVKAALIGTITVKGARQVTYAGHPLYTYAADSGPGDVSYVGASQFGGSWPALNAAGQEVK